MPQGCCQWAPAAMQQLLWHRALAAPGGFMALVKVVHGLLIPVYAPDTPVLPPPLLATPSHPHPRPPAPHQVMARMLPVLKSSLVEDLCKERPVPMDTDAAEPAAGGAAVAAAAAGAGGPGAAAAMAAAAAAAAAAGAPGEPLGAGEPPGMAGARAMLAAGQAGLPRRGMQPMVPPPGLLLHRPPPPPEGGAR
jgi:hypothetical protein